MTTTEHKPIHRIEIVIDEVAYLVDDRELTGAELRAVPNPDVPANRDLFLETPGPRDDVLIEPAKRYRVHRGSRFYTAPSTINPGAR
jgi:hypothetical protein